MANYWIVRENDIEKKFNEKGFSMTEVLGGTYDGGIRHYKCYLKAGYTVSPELYAEETVVVMFGKGTGYITSDHDLFQITEPSFYAPKFDQEPYTVHAVEDMEFVISVVVMNQWDKKMYNEGHIRLPFFMKYSDGQIYDQDCKGPNTTSWMILGPEQLGRIMVGVVKAVGEGTVEKGHPAVHQWNYCLGNADFNLTVDNEAPVRHMAGELSFIPAGADHSLVADSGKEVFYVWFEHFTRERDFKVCLAAGEKLEDKLNYEK